MFPRRATCVCDYTIFVRDICAVRSESKKFAGYKKHFGHAQISLQWVKTFQWEIDFHIPFVIHSCGWDLRRIVYRWTALIYEQFFADCCWRRAESSRLQLLCRMVMPLKAMHTASTSRFFAPVPFLYVEHRGFRQIDDPLIVLCFYLFPSV